MNNLCNIKFAGNTSMLPTQNFTKKLNIKRCLFMLRLFGELFSALYYPKTVSRTGQRTPNNAGG